MLRLDLPTESEWIACPHGVRLLCRPLTTAINQAAITRAGRRIAVLGSEAKPDPDLAAGVHFSEAVVALGEMLIEDWDGVARADGTGPAPLTPDGIRALLSVASIADAFNVGIGAPFVRLTAEGNA